MTQIIINVMTSQNDVNEIGSIAHTPQLYPAHNTIGGKSYGRREGASQKLLKVAESFGKICIYSVF